MNDSRRSFLKKAAALAGGAGAWSVLPASINKALAISPDKGTTFYDAEHVVMLMQENRSFDHCFGTMRGVRGFNDPLAIQLPDKNPVWFQPDKSGNRFVPFRLDIKDTKATWMGGVPHSWEDQVDARNGGKYDGWIEAKRPGNKEYKEIPLTMGYYTREDLPFYYSLADAFTICDQHFCAALTGTTTNRSYFWTGKTHGAEGDKAKVRNGELNYEHEASWTTFPERLEDHGISWKVYQNEISLPTNVQDDSLLANFTDNNLEWFTQYGVRFAVGYYEFLKKRQKELPQEIKALEMVTDASPSGDTERAKQLMERKNELAQVTEHLEKYSPEKFEELSLRQRSLHKKAFTTNIGDPDYHQVEDLSYSVNGEERSIKVPKGDILHQFRKDVQSGQLPTVTWLVAPQKFSDHPSAPWYGAWYVSEVLDVLTQNPEVWKKTIFILNYDENDGYFDHIPPFVPPHPAMPDTGKISAGLHMNGEFVTTDEEIKAGFKEDRSRTSPVGLGFRVPLIIASPWSRGGWVNSEVCDITSTIMFLENFLSKKTGKNIIEPNISSWRRTVSGNLTSVFRPYQGEDVTLPKWLDRDGHVTETHKASLKKLPDNFRALTEEEVARIARGESQSSILPRQEEGTKPSNGLKYDLSVDGKLSGDGDDFAIRFRAGKELFGDESLGAPFNVYAPNTFRGEASKVWAFAVKAGDEVEYTWSLKDFEGGQYHLKVYGPNGFFRDFSGNREKSMEVACAPEVKGAKVRGNLRVEVKNSGKNPLRLLWSDDTYNKHATDFTLAAGSKKTFIVDTNKVHGWYRFSLASEEANGCNVHYAGRLENGSDRISDPFMGMDRKVE